MSERIGASDIHIPLEFRPLISLKAIADSHGREHYTYFPKEQLNPRMLSLLENFENNYPVLQLQEVFNFIRRQLDKRYPVLPEDRKSSDPARDNPYESRYAPDFRTIFDFISCFPPTEEQYRFLSLFLFHPDLDVRHAAARAIERRLAFYDPQIGREYERIIDSDPDSLGPYRGRLKMWVNHDREFYSKEGIDRWNSFIASGVFGRPELDESVDSEFLRIYFGLGEGNYYEPREAAEKEKIDKEITISEALLAIVQNAIRLQEREELTDEVRKKLLRQSEEIETDLRPRSISIPSVYRMARQLWRLEQKEIIAAVGRMINRPEVFDVDSYSGTLRDWARARIVAEGIRTCVFMEDAKVVKVMFDNVLGSYKWRGNNEVLMAIARVCYKLPVEVQVKDIFPIISMHPGEFGENLRLFFYSLGTAVVREISKETLPEYGMKGRK